MEFISYVDNRLSIPYYQAVHHITFTTPLESLFRLPPKRKAGLRHLKLLTVRDLFYHIPHRYERPAVVQTVAQTHEGDTVTVEGKILSIEAKKTWKTKKPMAEAVVIDAPGASIRAIWFHQPYVARQLPIGTFVRLSGKVTKYKNKLTMINPVHERINGRPTNVGRIPIYSETYGVSSRWIRAAIENIFLRLTPDAFVDPLPEDMRQRYHLPSLKRALEAIHFSQNEKEAEGARKRFAFEEIFFIQLSRVAMRNERNKQRAAAIIIDHDLLQKFKASLPFALTHAQERVIEEIGNDMGSSEVSAPPARRAGPKTPMSRLLQGDVGSGKTLVAAAAVLHVAASGYQTAYMAPTEILARQHFAEFCKRLGSFGVRIGLLTSSEALHFPSKSFPDKPAHISKQQLFKKVKEGLVDVVIGTHALIARRKSYEVEPREILTRFNLGISLGISFKNLAFVIVDEQHRFGINQRAEILRVAVNNTAPHYLSMTATPIPRTLALTIYGDLDLSLLDEMPPGRVLPRTQVLAPAQREEAYRAIADAIAAGRQAFVICPRIKEDDESGMKAVLGEHTRLQNAVFPDHIVGVLHGKLTPKEKEQTMAAFRENKFPILVATTVVEVGVDVPNATVMLIEGAERFGLAQLHQLRGRIGRSPAAAGSICLAIPASSSKFVKERLHAFANLKDGFALAEQDLQLRGPGELTGTSQWGISDVGMEALRNIKMVEAARQEAQRMLALKKAPAFVRASAHLE